MNTQAIIQVMILTLTVSSASVLISSIIAIPLAAVLGLGHGKLCNILRNVVTAFIGIPPILAGLFIYMLIRRGGILGSLSILFTPSAMIIAQIIIVVPMITGVIYPSIMQKRSHMMLTLHGLNIKGFKRIKIIMFEMRESAVAAILSGFGRAVSEVGAVMLVGGNIENKTRVMTTAIMLETGKGNFEFALIMGLILLSITLIINILVSRMANSNKI